MSINGFYGGRQGQNFYISKVFENFTSLKADIADKYNSNIGFGEYVMINYGAPTGYGFICKVEEQTGTNPDTYEETTKLAVNFKADGLIKLRNNMTEDKATYNIEYDGNSFTVNPLSNYADLRITEHCETTNFKITCTFTDESIKNLTIDKKSEFGYNYNNTLWKKISGSEKDTTGIKIQYFDTEEDINANSVGYELITYLGGNIPTITVNTKKIDADLEPSVSYSQLVIDNPHFTFNLPHRQVFIEEVDYQEYTPLKNSKSTTQIVYEKENDPDVSINNPQLKIHLPRDIKFWSGDEEIDQQIKNNGYVLPYIDNTSGEETIPNLTITGKKDYGNEDYYIHTDTAYIYKVINATLDSFNLQYVSKLVQRAPDGWKETKELDTFDANGKLNKFSITNSTNENHDWKLQLHAPKPVSFINPTTTILDPKNSPSVTQVIQEDAYQLRFKLPRASVWSHGEGKPTQPQIEGDYYLDTKEGKVYSVNEEIADLTGPQGPAGASYFLQDTLKVKVDATKTIIIDNQAETLDENSSVINYITNYITTKYPPETYETAPMLMVEVIEYDEQNEISSFISYNYYIANKIWRYVQISGQASAVETEIANLTFMFDGGTLSDEVGV